VPAPLTYRPGHPATLPDVAGAFHGQIWRSKNRTSALPNARRAPTLRLTLVLAMMSANFMNSLSCPRSQDSDPGSPETAHLPQTKGMRSRSCLLEGPDIELALLYCNINHK
jgi:hypothetical protein